MINVFPVQDRVSETLSPSTIVDGHQKLDMSAKLINFISVAFIHFKTTNTMKSRNMSAIAFRPSNENCGHYFFSIKTNRRMHSYI